MSHTTIIYHIDVHDLFMILICFQGFGEDFVTTTPIVILEFHSRALCRHQLPEACWLTMLASGEKWALGSSVSSVEDGFHHTSTVARNGAMVSEIRHVLMSDFLFAGAMGWMSLHVGRSPRTCYWSLVF